jgi:hypothetical protein
MGRHLTILFIAIIHFQIVAHAQKGGQKTLFTLMSPRETGVKFTNRIEEDDSLHVFRYEYLYNGHGTGLADFNNDGLIDIFISGNAVPDKLFLNKGNFRFEDITGAAGVGGNRTWSTGVSIADVNGDGLADIYVCHSGYYKDPASLRNELFVNLGIKDGKPVFKEMALEYKLDAPGTQSTQAAFFDYDRDGDLDMFLLNHSNHTYNPFLNTRTQRATPNFNFGNRLFRNDADQNGQPVFTDVTLEAGIINNSLNFGLGIVISDLNQDGWPDIYTTSDYTEQDNYYVNNKNGTFTQSLQQSFTHISKYSMGADIADYNNDGLPDVLTLDMLPEDNYRQKMLKGPDEYDQYHLLLDSGYYHQQMRNMLHLNRGVDANNNLRFSEIGQLAGVSNTDWSWAGLLADLNNDGYKDLLVTNGYLRDFTDMDFLKYTVADEQLEQASKGNLNFKTYHLVKKMPSNKLENYLFKNNGDLTFRDVSKDWGFSERSISNGAAYADLDNDGDLDLIICNNNEPVMLYRNNLDGQRHYLKLDITYDKKNKAAFGTKVWVYHGKTVQYQELFPVRGYQSTVTPQLSFGLADVTSVDSIIIQWPGGEMDRLSSVAADQTLKLRPASANKEIEKPRSAKTMFVEVSKTELPHFRHIENDFIDFKDEVLLPYQLSKAGPAMAKADINNDGLEDIFFGGAIGQAGKLLLQKKDGGFTESPSQPWTADAACEDVNALFLDVNKDGFPDLYVVSGGNEYMDGSPEYADRIYLNDGKGGFLKVPDALPAMLNSKHAIAAADFDRDGDTDLFIGGYCVPGSFPYSSRSYLLRNDTKEGVIKFTDITSAVIGLENPGIVMTATWFEPEKNGYPSLMIGGEWMPLRLFRNDNGTLKDISSAAGLDRTEGLWSSLNPVDIDNDGDIDFIAGNCGTNNQFKASLEEPITIVANDFDDNGTVDPIVSYYIKGKSYPMASRDELLDAIVPLRKKFVKYRDYANAELSHIFSKEKIAAAKRYYCYQLSTSLLINEGNQSFTIQPLPLEAQFSRTFGAIAKDFDKDGHTDILIGGNFYPYRVQLGQCDAGMGLLLKGKGDRRFEAVSPVISGLYIDGDVRRMLPVKNGRGEDMVVFGVNNGETRVIKENQ